MAGHGLKGRHFLSIHDYTPEEVRLFLDTADHIKREWRLGHAGKPLAGKTLGMIFHKPSTRTRISFEVGVWQLGGSALHLRADELQLSRGETIADTARVLSRYLDGIMIRTYSHNDVVELATYSTVPVINGLTDRLHPCQIMTDLLTIREQKGRLADLKMVYVGDGNNVAHSLLFGAAKTGLHLTVVGPAGYEPEPDIVELARADATATGSCLEITNDLEAAIIGADVVYTDVWASMGQDQEREARIKVFQPYQVNDDLMARAKPDAIFMHDLPAHRGEEVTDEVMDGSRSVVFDQAENRMHAQKAIMALLM